jgi:hypothetical protein
MGWFFIASLIVLLFWFGYRLYSDDASAIETFDSAENVPRKQETETKSEISRDRHLEGVN